MPAQMTFRPAETPLRDLLEEIHRGVLQLPDFQRSWVWDDDRISDLVASVSQAWPVGAVLLLECGGDVQFKARSVEGAPENPGLERRLILDGQQRLTALYSTFRAGVPVPTLDTKGNAIKRVYFFDIRKCLDEGIERKEAVLALDPSLQVRSNFNRTIDLDLSTPEKCYENLCIPVATVFDVAASQDWRYGLSDFHQHAAEIAKLWNRFEREVIQSIQQYRVPSIELGRTTSRQAICMVFEKVNTGGKPLDVFELVTATYAARSVDMRVEWDKRQRALAAHGILGEIIATDFLQAISLLSSWKRGANDRRIHVGCRRVDMLNLPLEEYNVHADAVYEGFVTASRLLERERIFDTRYLPYKSQLIPFAAIAAALGPRVDEPTAREKLLRWYWCGVFGELYGGTTETRFGKDISEVLLWIDGGPEPSTVRDCNFSPSRLATLSMRLSAAYKGFMALLLQRGARDLLSGDEIERSTYFAQDVDLHHAFPDSWFTGKTGQFPPSIQKSILNKTPRTSRTWKRLGLVNPSVYLARVERGGVKANDLDELLRTHCMDARSLRQDDFATFYRERARRLLDGVERLTGKPINGRDSEETRRTFGGPLPTVVSEDRRPTETLFDQYEVLARMPGGGMSDGFKVRGRDGTIAFMKKVPVDGLAGDALRREIDVYTRLHRADSDGVLRVLGIEHNDTHVALLTEFADGGTLDAFVRAKPEPLTPAESKAIALTVLAALRELHSLDVVHRDLKPENVLCVGGRWKLGDFGIAKNLRRLVTQHRTFAGLGTPGFAPPEQVDGAEAHPSADVYAFGKLLAYLLTGQTDVDKVMLPSWVKLSRACTTHEPGARPGLDEVETTLAAIVV